MTSDAWFGRPSRPLPLIAVLLGLALPAFAALLHGAAAFVLLLLAPATLLVVWRPLLLVAIPLLLAPLLGRTTDDTIGPLNAMALLALWTTGIGGIAVLTRWRELLHERLLLPFVGMLLLIGISIGVSSHKATSIEELFRATASLMLLLVAYLYAQRGVQRKEVAGCVLLSTACPLVVGCYQMFTGDVDYGQGATLYELESGITRIYATFWDVHPFAKFLLVVAPVVLVLVLGERTSLRRWALGLVLLGIVVVNLTFTFARSEIIGLAIAVALILHRLGHLRLRLLLVLAPVIIAFAFATGLTGRFADIFQPVDLQSGLRENSLESRVLIWIKGWHLAIQQPVLGHGAATFEMDVGMESHNVYLGLFYELGMLGPITYFLSLYTSFRYASAASRTLGVSRWDRQIAVAVFGITGAIIIVSAVENYAEATTMWWPYFALLGCTAAALREARELPYAHGIVLAGDQQGPLEAAVGART